MPLITDHLRDAIWLEGEPDATEAFERIAADHGRAFAEAFRDQILSAKHLDQQEDEIRHIRGADR